jgi:hypothetical protein
MERYPRFPFSINQDPVDRNPTTVFREKRTMKIQATRFRNVKDFALKELAVIKREKDVRFFSFDFLYPERVIDIHGREDRDVVFRSKFCHGIEPDLFLWIIFVGKHHRNLKAVLQKGFDAHATDIAVR